ncbi:MAG: hypothetical protein KDD64_13400 [Bdellovibrionales bacterium]|nr:hypothetical protein [Bdellovibrionales bacterium]
MREPQRDQLQRGTSSPPFPKAEATVSRDDLVAAYGIAPFSEENFSKMLERASYRDIVQVLSKSVARENLLGEGMNCHVFRIPGVQAYALRLPKRIARLEGRDSFSEVEDPFPDLNFGQPVGRFRNALIIKRAPGVSLSQFRDQEQRQIDCQKRFEELADLPDRSFQLFVAAVSALNAKNLLLDSLHSGNVLLDKSGLLLTPIDFEKRPEAGSLNSLSDVANALFEVGTSFEPLSHMKFERSLVRQLLHKVIHASLTLGLPKANQNDRAFQAICRQAGIDITLLTA